MPKMDGTFNPVDYAPVAHRITHFYERFPTGRIVTKLVSRVDRGRGVFEITMRALVYRAAEDMRVAATGYASEREDDGDINAVACVENTETSAIGRALANLGFTAALQRPSAEEMAKAERARARLRRESAIAAAASSPLTTGMGDVPNARRCADFRSLQHTVGDSTRQTPPSSVTLQTRADHVSDLLDLLRAAGRAGLREYRSGVVRTWLLEQDVSTALLDRLSRRLRRWIAESAESMPSVHAARNHGLANSGQ